MSPRGPKEKMNAIEVVNGGEMSGSKVIASITRTQAGLRFARLTVKAKRKPSAVPMTPTKVPSSSELTKARCVPGFCRTSSTGWSAGRPSSTNAVPASIRRG